MTTLDTVSPARERLNQAALAQLDGRLDEAQRAYETLLGEEPENATVLNNLGFLRAQRGQWQEAIELYQRSIEHAPDRSMTYANFGVAQAALGRDAEALAALERAVSLEPRNTTAWDSLARFHFVRNRAAEAEKAWRSALTIVPLDARTRAAVATALAAQGRIPAAAHELRQAIAIEPNDAVLWQQLGTVLMVRGDFGSAEEALERAMKLSPEPNTRHRLAQVHVARGRADQARSELKAVLAEVPEHMDAAVDLGIIELSQGDANVALELFESVLDRRGDDPRVRFYRALTLDRASRREEGIAALRSLESLQDTWGQKSRRVLKEWGAHAQ